MNQTTAQQLVDQTKNFYDLVANSFDQSRQSPWMGWYELLPMLKQFEPCQLLDIGCGNGRWFKFLEEHQIIIEGALGIDNSINLLKKGYISKFITYKKGDLLQLTKESGNCITAFGVWHHIPGRNQRKNLLESLLRRVIKPGIVIVSLWHVTDKQEIYTRDDLEPGDMLVGWQNRPGLIRYCHRFEEEEIEELMSIKSLTVGRFEADGKDGKSNTYLYYIAR